MAATARAPAVKAAARVLAPVSVESLSSPGAAHAPTVNLTVAGPSPTLVHPDVPSFLT